jgi:hypothetical protein
MRNLTTSYRLKQTLGDGTAMWLSGWSQHRLQPTFSLDENAGLIWVDDARFDRWKAKHPSLEWDYVTLEKVYMPEGRDRGGDRFRRIGRRAA